MEKKGYNIVDFEEADERQRTEYLKIKQFKRIRVTVGGEFKDFESPEEALKYMTRRLQVFSYASINTVYPGVLKLHQTILLSQ